MATTQPFTILVLGEQTPELDALAALGLTIIYGGVFTVNGATLVIDQVMGPRCWRLLPDQQKWLPLTLKEMRAAQPKPKKSKRAPKAGDIVDGSPITQELLDVLKKGSKV